MSDKKIIYFLLCLACFTISFNVTAIVAAIPAIANDLRLPDMEVSRIIPTYMIPYGVGALIYAPLTRKVNYRRILGWTMLSYGMFSLVCAVNNSMNIFTLGRIGMGLTGGSAIPLGLILIGKLFPKNVRGRLVGGFFGCSFISSVLGILLHGVAPWRWLFGVPAVLGVATALGVLSCRAADMNQRHDKPVGYLKTLMTPSIQRVFIFIFIVSCLYHGVHNWYGVYLSRNYGLDKLAISLLILLTAVSGFFGQMIGGVITDKAGRLSACKLGFMILALPVILLSGHHAIFITAVLIMLIAAGWTIGHNGISTALTDFPDEHRPEIASLNSSLRFISGGVGFQLSGLLVERSFNLNFLTIGALMVISLFFLKKVIPET